MTVTVKKIENRSIFVEAMKLAGFQTSRLQSHQRCFPPFRSLKVYILYCMSDKVTMSHFIVYLYSLYLRMFAYILQYVKRNKNMMMN